MKLFLCQQPPYLKYLGGWNAIMNESKIHVSLLPREMEERNRREQGDNERVKDTSQHWCCRWKEKIDGLELTVESLVSDKNSIV